MFFKYLFIEPATEASLMLVVFEAVLHVSSYRVQANREEMKVRVYFLFNLAKALLPPQLPEFAAEIHAKPKP